MKYKEVLVRMTVIRTMQASTMGTGAVRPRRGPFRRRFGRWLALSEQGFPFFVGRCATPTDRFRAFARRTRLSHHGLGMRLLTFMAMTLAWPFGAFASTRRICTSLRKQGRNYGPWQCAAMYMAALRHSVPPMEYALYRFEETQRREDMHDYVYWNDAGALRLLNARRGADNRDVQDKDRFAEICAAHGLPHVATLASFDGGRQTFPNGRFVPTAAALWVKSLRRHGGAGAMKWTGDGDTYRDWNGRAVRAAAITGEFSKADCIVQPCLTNHPAIARVCNGALAALRIVTGIDAAGGAVFVTALLALPCGAPQTSGAAVLCSIDPHTGRIRHAAQPGGAPVTHHPDTDAALAGLELPFWQASKDLALRAHAAAFGGFAFLGWDVALTADGPLLLEANSGWGPIYHQMLDGPIGHTAFGRLVTQYV